MTGLVRRAQFGGRSCHLIGGWAALARAELLLTAGQSFLAHACGSTRIAPPQPLPLALWPVLLNGSSFNPSERPRRKQLAVSGSSPQARWQPSDDEEIGSLQRASISPKAEMRAGSSPWELCCLGSSPRFGDEDPRRGK